MLDELKTLCGINGISGDEVTVADYICSQLDGIAEYKKDNLGSIIAFKKGRRTSGKRVMVSAHMDEVGMIVTYINADGTLKISPVGGIDPRAVFGRRVEIGKNRICGVIGGKAVHNLTAEERKKSAPFEAMTVDVGTDSREETSKLVSPGDSVCFSSQFTEFGDGLLASKAIDDRAGCAVMLKLIRDELEYDTYFTFVVQEEIGLRGSACAAYAVNPDAALVLEATTAADVPSASEEKRVCALKKGPVVSFMDRHTIYDKELYDLAFKTAEELDIPCQTKSMVAGGNDAGAIHVSHGGVRTAAISLPCRYLHTPYCVIAYEDLENSYLLAKKFIDRIHER
nr:M42 family peptidase [Ruminococcus sp. Marseille-P6503]